jgi:hypothetical protein
MTDDAMNVEPTSLMSRLWIDADVYKLYDSIKVRCPRGDTHKCQCSWTGKLSALVEHIYAFEPVDIVASSIASDNTVTSEIVKELKCAINEMTQRLDRTNQLLEQSQRADNHARCIVHSNFNVDIFDCSSHEDVDELIKYLGSHWTHIAPDRAFCNKLYQCIIGTGNAQIEKLHQNAVSDLSPETVRTVLVLGAGMSWFDLSETIAIERLLQDFQD